MHRACILGVTHVKIVFALICFNSDFRYGYQCLACRREPRSSKERILAEVDGDVAGAVLRPGRVHRRDRAVLDDDHRAAASFTAATMLS